MSKFEFDEDELFKFEIKSKAMEEQVDKIRDSILELTAIRFLELRGFKVKKRKWWK